MSSFLGKRFVDGVTVLTLSTIFVKVMGLVYKIPLMHVLGAEGMGYFNSAYEMYTLFFIISTAGVPIAISIMISESMAKGRIRNAEKTFMKSLFLLVLIGTLGSLFMCFGADLISKAINSSGSRRAIVFVAPTVLFISISGAVRGYFQGNGNMTPTAVSQVVEALGRLVLGLSFAVIAKNKGLPTDEVAAFSILGLTVGTAISCAYLCIVKSVKKQKLSLEDGFTKSSREIIAGLLRLSVPVTVSSVIISLTRIIDMTMLMRRLQGADKISVYGAYSTMALPIYNLPSSLVAGIAVALVPTAVLAVNSFKVGEGNKGVNSAFKLCSIIALPASFGIGVYSKQILELLFSDEYDAIALSYPLLKILSVSIPASCLLLVSNSLLQASGKIMYPIYSITAGIVTKTVLSYVLIGIPQISAGGAPISTLACNLVSVAVSFYFIEKHTVFKINLKDTFIKPMTCAFLATIASALGFLLLGRMGCGEKTAFLIGAFICVTVYLLLIILTKTLDDYELSVFPLGKHLCKINMGKIKNEKRRRNKKPFIEGKI